MVYFQIWNKKEHNIIIIVISSHMDSMCIETSYIIDFKFSRFLRWSFFSFLSFFDKFFFILFVYEVFLSSYLPINVSLLKIFSSSLWTLFWNYYILKIYVVERIQHFQVFYSFLSLNINHFNQNQILSYINITCPTVISNLFLYIILFFFTM